MTSLIRADGLVCAVSGAAIAVAAPWLDDILGIPLSVLLAVGVGLVAYAAVLLVLARRGAPAAGVCAVVAANVLWALASVAVVAGDWLTLTAAGTALVLLQAAAVAGLAGVELRTLRQAAA
jgi:hypothetical protein